MRSNYAFKPIAEQARRPNNIIVPQRLNAALAFEGPIMEICKFCLLFSLSIFGAEAAAGEEQCGVMVDGKLVDDSTLKIGSLSDDDLLQPLQVSSGQLVQAIICFRDSLVPSRNDYKALLAGVPFAIKSGEKVLWLEIDDGKLGFSFDEDALNEKETASVQLWLDGAQTKFDRASSSLRDEG